MLKKEIRSASKSISSCINSYAAPLPISRWDFCLWHCHFLFAMEEKMLKFLSFDPFHLTTVRQTFSLQVCSLLPLKATLSHFFLCFYQESFVTRNTTLVWMGRVTNLLKGFWEILKNADRHGIESVCICHWHHSRWESTFLKTVK